MDNHVYMYSCPCDLWPQTRHRSSDYVIVFLTDVININSEP